MPEPENRLSVPNVVVKGTTNGSITNFDGEYELTATDWLYSVSLLLVTNQ